MTAMTSQFSILASFHSIRLSSWPAWGEPITPTLWHHARLDCKSSFLRSGYCDCFPYCEFI